MDPWTVPKIMTVCITLISSVRLVSSAQPSKGTSHTSQNQSSAVSQSSTKPNTTGTTGTPANHKSTGNPSQTSGSGTHVNSSNEQPKDTTPKAGSTSGSNSSALRSQSSIPAEPNQDKQNGSKKENLTTINSSFPEFKIVTQDPSDNTKTKENNTSQYNFKVTSYLITYKFKSNSRCSEILFGGKSLWKYNHEKHKGNFPTYIFAHTNIKKVYVRTTDSLFVCSLSDQTLSDSAVNALRLDIKSEKSSDKYHYSKDEKTKVVIFTAKDNVVFQELIKKKNCYSCGSDKTLYEAKFYHESPFKVVVEGLGSKNEKLTLYLVNGRVLTLTKANNYSYNPKPWVDFGPLGLKIFTEGSTSENDSTKYDIFEVGDIFDYIFKEGTKCTGVKYKDQVVWKYDKDKHKSYPKSISFDRVEVRFLFNFGSENIIYNKEGNEWKEILSKLSTIDIDSRESTEKYAFSKYNSKFATFTAKKGYGFSKVLGKVGGCCSSDEVVWKAENKDEYAVKVTRDGIDTCKSLHQVSVELANGDVLKYSKIGGCCSTKQWIHDETKKGLSKQNKSSNNNNHNQSSKTVQLIVLNVNNSGSTDQFDYSTYDEKSNIAFFTAKEGHGFNKIVKKKRFRKDTVLWEADETNEHAVKLLIDGLGSLESTVHLQVYLANQDLLKFVKVGICCKNWTHEATKRHISSSKSSQSESVTPVSQTSLQGSSSSQNPEDSKQTKPAENATPKTATQSPVSSTPAGTAAPKTTATPVAQDSKDAKPAGTATPSTVPAKETTPKTATPTQGSGGGVSTPAKPSTPKAASTPSTPQSSGGGGSTPAKAKDPPKHPSKLKISTEGSTKENDSTKYTLKQYNNFLKFEFKDDAKCKKVVYDNKTLFEFGKNEPKNKSPKEIYYNDDTKYVYLGLYRTKFVPRYESNDWECESGTTDKKLEKSKFKISTEGSTSENDSTKYDERNEGSFVKCEFKDGAKCTGVKYDTQQVYKHDVNQNSGKHPKCLYFHKLMKVVFAEFEDDVFVFLRFDLDSETWESENLDKMQNLDINNFKVFTPDGENEKENDTNMTEKKTFGSLLCYIVKKDDADYFVFKYGNDIVISLYNYSGRPKFKEIYFLLDSQKNLVLLEDKSLYVLKR